MPHTPATSGYLTRPLRSEAAFTAGRHKRRAWELVKALRHQAALTINGGSDGTGRAEKQAGELLDNARAVEWLLEQLDKMDERAEEIKS